LTPELAKTGRSSPDWRAGFVEVVGDVGQIEERDIEEFEDAVAGAGVVVGDLMEWEMSCQSVWAGGRRSWSRRRCGRLLRRFDEDAAGKEKGVGGAVDLGAPDAGGRRDCR